MQQVHARIQMVISMEDYPVAPPLAEDHSPARAGEVTGNARAGMRRRRDATAALLLLRLARQRPRDTRRLDRQLLLTNGTGHIARMRLTDDATHRNFCAGGEK